MTRRLNLHTVAGSVLDRLPNSLTWFRPNQSDEVTNYMAVCEINSDFVMTDEISGARRGQINTRIVSNVSWKLIISGNSMTRDNLIDDAITAIIETLDDACDNYEFDSFNLSNLESEPLEGDQGGDRWTAKITATIQNQ